MPLAWQAMPGLGRQIAVGSQKQSETKVDHAYLYQLPTLCTK